MERRNILQATENPVPWTDKISATRVVSTEEYWHLMDEMSKAALAYQEVLDGDANSNGLQKLEEEMLSAMGAYNKAVRPKGLYRYLMSGQKG